MRRSFCAKELLCTRRHGSVEFPCVTRPTVAPPEGITAPQLTLIGTVTVSLDDGTEVEMDAKAYMDQLKSEAEALRRELRSME